MSNTNLAMHYVCTPPQARALVEAHSQYWVSNCGCREGRQRCARSRWDLCLMFTPADPGSGSGKREASRADVESILREAQDKHLVARPFRNEARTATDGICFCCDDCCGYFLAPPEPCDPGDQVTVTNWDQCSQCGLCVDVCYFAARRLNGAELLVEPARCYGCGLCVAVCPEDCIQMAPRA
ncbi:MAG: 4Fe-4S binding protein [Chloroflexi bacterium]|nr:4Fe-4S binding protein [Chloroflexota bacterium]MBU1747221.1 4Fe-4S binding protein [Chloroflexota bacterium]